MANNDMVGSVVKAMALIKIVSSAPGGMRMSELAAAANLKTVTCFNLVRTLVAGGFLEKINGRLYVGSEITRLSANRFQTDFFRKAEAVLLKLNRSWPQATAIFAVPGADGMEQTHRISFDHPGVIQRLNTEPIPPYASAAGLLGLTFIQDADILLRLEEKFPFAEFGINLWKSRNELERFLQKCREERLVVAPFEVDVLHRVSVPVFDRSGKFTAVIGLSCPVRDFKESDFLEMHCALKKAAENFN